MTIKKQYLTTVEIMKIGENMKMYSSYITREMAKWLLICDYCTDIELDKETNEETGDVTLLLNTETYDKLVEDGTLELLQDYETGIKNHLDCDLEYESLMDIKQVAVETLTKISDKIEKTDFSKIDIKGMLAKVMVAVQGLKK